MAVNGALLTLADPENWEQFGIATADDVAALMQTMVLDFINDTGCESLGGEMVGQIVAGVYADGSSPDNWLLCDGSTYALNDYPALAAVISASLVFGENFITPDLRNRTIIGSSVTHPEYVTGGTETHNLVTAELPSHLHGMNAAVSVLTHGGFLPVSDVVYGAGGSTLNAGSDNAHNNMPPYMPLRYWLVAA